jgi:YfiH family protein
MSVSVGDEPAFVAENVSRLAASVALRDGFRTVSQVHGNETIEVNSTGTDRSAPRADALWTSRSEVAVAVKTADCVPALIVDPKKKRVAAVHSGWRGTELRVVEKAIQALEASGTDVADLLIALGPSIRQCCYEVSEELAARFSTQFGGEVTSFDHGRPHLDLISAVTSSIRRAGVPKKNIDILPHCTACDEANFFSHRRDRGQTGRHLNFIVCRF